MTDESEGQKKDSEEEVKEKKEITWGEITDEQARSQADLRRSIRGGKWKNWRSMKRTKL
jgi:hypothetical protein